MLILQIAAGIILAVLILNYLPRIVFGSVYLAKQSLKFLTVLMALVVVYLSIWGRDQAQLTSIVIASVLVAYFLYVVCLALVDAFYLLCVAKTGATIADLASVFVLFLLSGTAIVVAVNYSGEEGFHGYNCFFSMYYDLFCLCIV